MAPPYRKTTSRLKVWLLSAALQTIAFVVAGGWQTDAYTLAAFVVWCVLSSTVLVLLLVPQRPVGGSDSVATEPHEPRTEPEQPQRRAPVSDTERELRKAVYDLQNLFAVSVDLSSVRDVDELARKLVLHVLGLMRVNKAALAIPEDRSDLRFKRRYGGGLAEASLVALPLDARDPWVRKVIAAGKPSLIGTALRTEEKLAAAGFALALPLQQSGKVEGLLLLGPKVSGTAFSSSELQMLSLLGNMASVALSNSRLYLELEASAITDALTGLYNRRYFDRRLVEEMARARRLDLPLSLVLVDIDHFKRYNDELGHPAGDALLQTLAGIFKATSRETDIWARYGGEEFAAILPAVPREGSRVFAERVRLAVLAMETADEVEKPVRVTVSLGAATYPHDAKLVRELVVRADRALYAAKNQGRNRSVLFSDLLPSERA